jgi:hypothetical protein
LSYPGALNEANRWASTVVSVNDGTRPVVAMGTTITPGNNTYGTAVTLISGANLTFDCCELVICINNASISNTARDTVVSLLVDPAGGTSFTSIADLVCGPASGYVVANVGFGGTLFRFPIFIKAGTSIGCAAAVNSATVTSLNAFCRANGQPSHPDKIFVGTYIDQFGVSLATSAGTTVTPGTTSDGAYVLIGTTARPLYALEFGYGINDSTMTSAVIDVDIAAGDGTTNSVIIPNWPVATSAIEAVSKFPAMTLTSIAAGVGLYARSQSSNAIDSANSVAIYGVG